MEEELQRGTGKGVGNTPVGDAGVSYCVCPKCNTKVEHKRSVPCNNQSCPKCGTAMIGL